MYISFLENNPMGLVIFTLPLLTLTISFGIQLLIKKKLITLGIILLAYLIATFVFFNVTFLIWCFVYTVIAWIGTLIADWVLNRNKKRI